MLKNTKFPITIKSINKNSNSNMDVWEITNICYSYDSKDYCYLIKSCTNVNSSIYTIKENDLVRNFKLLNDDQTLSEIETLDTLKNYNNIFKDMSEDEVRDFFSYYTNK